MKAPRRKLLIFGCGQGGVRARKSVFRNEELIGFSDNDPKKHGTLFEGARVYGPDEILGLDLDIVLVASQYHVQICNQLLDMGVEAEKIEYLDVKVLTGECSPSTGVSLRIIGIAAVALALGLGAFWLNWV